MTPSTVAAWMCACLAATQIHAANVDPCNSGSRGVTSIFASHATSGFHFVHPGGIAMNSTGHLFVANEIATPGQGNFLVIDPHGHVRVYPESGAITMGEAPLDLCTMHQPGSNQSILFVATQTYVGRVVPGTASRAGRVDVIARGKSVRGLACSSKYPNSLFVTSNIISATTNDSSPGVQLVDIVSGKVSTISIESDGQADPRGIVVTPEGRLLVVNHAQDEILLIIPDISDNHGQSVQVASGDFFNKPRGIAIDGCANPNWYVTDPEGNNVMKIDTSKFQLEVLPDGTEMGSGTNIMFYASGSNFSRPSNIVCAPDGRLFVLNSGPSTGVGEGSVVEITPLSSDSDTNDNTNSRGSGSSGVNEHLQLIFGGTAVAAMGFCCLGIAYTRTKANSRASFWKFSDEEVVNGDEEDGAVGGKGRGSLVLPLLSGIGKGKSYGALNNGSSTKRFEDRELQKLLKPYAKHGWLISIADKRRLRLSSRIGSGQTGNVFKGNFMSTAAAIKQVVLPVGHQQKRQLIEQLLKEAAVLAELRHPNTVLFFGATFSCHDVLLVTELCEMSLEEALFADPDEESRTSTYWSRCEVAAARIAIRSEQENSGVVKSQTKAGRRMDENEGWNHEGYSGEHCEHCNGHPYRHYFRSWFGQLVSALVFLHSKCIIHRDIKPSNVLLTKSKNVKLCDFGLASRWSAQASMTAGVGTPAYMAPELASTMGMNGKHEFKNRSNASLHYSEKVDVYSFAVLCWSMWMGAQPYQKQVQQMNMFSLLAVIIDGVRPDLPLSCPPSLTKVLKRCWATNSQERPSFDELWQQFESRTILNDLGLNEDRIQCEDL